MKSNSSFELFHFLLKVWIPFLEAYKTMEPVSFLTCHLIFKPSYFFRFSCHHTFPQQLVLLKRISVPSKEWLLQNKIAYGKHYSIIRKAATLSSGKLFFNQPNKDSFELLTAWLLKLWFKEQKLELSGEASWMILNYYLTTNLESEKRIPSLTTFFECSLIKANKLHTIR